ncbi:reverse transcriptase domain-containing protein [Tanacetum coccineum]|uniref:Reverse transcriptase domain-containing protein n=1 Tax=Tanacetum coccineum TaxID=301880 RepID=A0ABQ4ZN96_9ASTR
MPQKKRTATTTTTTTPMTDAQLKALIAQGVADALAERDANRSRNGDDSHDLGSDGRRRMPVARECTYSDFFKYQPLNFKGTEGVVGLTQWFKKMEFVFHINNSTVACQIKFSTCTLQGNALTWWNSHLALMCSRIFPEESDEVEKYVGGLPDMINGSVMASKPKTMQDSIEFATELMDQKIRTLAERQAKNKRKFEDTSRNNQNQQQPFKRNNVAWAYTAGHGEKKPSQPAVANNNQRAQGENQRVLTCFECGTQGHFKSNFLKLKNINQGNQDGNGNAVARAYGVGTVGTNPNSNVVTGTFLLKNCYASILVDTGADRSFVSTAFSSLIDIIPTILDHGYDVDHDGCGGDDDGDDGGVDDGDGVAMIDLVVAWLSAMVTGTVVVAGGGVAAGCLWCRRLMVVACGIGGGRRKYSPKKFFDGGWPEFGPRF